MKFVLVEPNSQLSVMLRSALERIAAPNEVTTIWAWEEADSIIAKTLLDTQVVFVSYQTQLDGGRKFIRSSAEVAKKIKGAYPGMKVVLMDIFQDENLVITRTYGLDGFILKTDFTDPVKLRRFFEQLKIEL